jgi:hypothetical protein
MRAKTKNLLVLAALALSTYSGWAQTKTTSPQPIPRAISFDVAKQIKHVETKLRLSLAQLKDTTRFARNVAINGSQWETTKYTDWTSGFFAGTLWYMYDLTQDPYWRTQAERWQAQLTAALPDIRRGDRLAGVHRPGQGVSFFHNGRLTGEVADATFARLFFAIWLGEATSAPELRQALIAGTTRP